MSIAGAGPDFAFLFRPGLPFISGATIFRVGLDVSVKPIWKFPHAQAQKLVFQVTLDPARLTILIITSCS